MSGYVSKEQIAKAKEIDLLTYLLRYEPSALKKISINEYCLIEHDSLKISNGRWHWFSRQIGGKTALDFLIKVRGMEFVDAVRILCDERVSPVSCFQPVNLPPAVQQKPKVDFALPEPDRDNFRIISYLLNRGIDREIIDRCIEEGTLYESKKNCVFVGKDSEGTPRFACMRSTVGNFKKDISGSNKQYGFTVPVRKQGSRSLFVFESPIDALSHATIDKISLTEQSWDSAHRLSLGGISSLALMQRLKDQPEIDCVCLCLDNDKAGIENMLKIQEMLKNTPHPEHSKYRVSIMPPSAGEKDFNDTLKAIRNIQKENINKNRQKAAVFI